MPLFCKSQQKNNSFAKIFVDVLDNADRDYNISINNNNTAYINIMLQTDTQCYNVDFLLKNNILHLTDFNVL